MTDEPPIDQTALELLRQLALDLRWSWNHAADKLWSRLEPDLWQRSHNPWVVLRTVSRQRLSKLLADAQFRAQIDGLAADTRAAKESAGWFQQTQPSSALNHVAYFSMEFMLSEALPIYAGGLGNVAGDHLKAASDLGIPVVGVGLLYQQGYFRQVIARDGGQQAFFPYNDPGQLPVKPLRTPDGEWLRIDIHLPGHVLWLRTWQVTVGRAQLFLLDSNDIANHPAHRGITSELYGGGPDLRLQQEMVLGIGGWRLLAALGLTPEVCHLNEGHAALVILERARDFMHANGQSSEAALAATRGGNLFTTHTAVPAGFDRFSPQLIEQYMSQYAREQLHISLDRLLALGRQNPADASESFNMAYLAVRGSATINGVSRLHGEVSRRIFEPLFPRWPLAEVPVSYVTNGIHTPSWDSTAADDLWTESCGKSRWLGELRSMDNHVRQISDERLWQARATARAELIAFARERLVSELTTAGATAQEVDIAGHLFRPGVLTLGFARRFATYKRPNLLLQDPERLVRLLTNPQQPVQLIIAGKAHPADAAGQALIREWVQFIRREDVRSHATFLDDYDMLLTERLVQGVDVWINTPRRPWEACGTSGMKVLVNGGLNVSELDGWWAEAYSADIGWALGDGREHGEDPAWDAAEARQLLDMLEKQVVPEFYTRDAHDIPRAWVARVRESMARLTPIYSANRSARQYLQEGYLPAATVYRARAANGGAEGARIASGLAALEYNWPAVRFGQLRTSTLADHHDFQVDIHLAALRPDSVRVEIYANTSGSEAGCRVPMTRIAPGDSDGEHRYQGSVATIRPVGDFTIRIVPAYPGVQVPLEAPLVCWQH